MSCSLQKNDSESVELGTEKVGNHGIMHRGIETVEAPVTPTPEERKKKEVAERLDTSGLLYSGKVVTDKDKKNA